MTTRGGGAPRRRLRPAGLAVVTVAVAEVAAALVGACMMSKVSGEIYRVLKPEAVATVVFHSASSSVWRALSTAYGTAGFGVRATSVLDKLQASFKQVVSSVSVKGDPLILLSKCADRASGPAISTDDVIEQIFRTSESGSAPERDRQRLYSRFVSRCLELGMEVEGREGVLRSGGLGTKKLGP